MRGFKIGDTVRWHPTEGSPLEGLEVVGEVADAQLLRVLSVSGTDPRQQWWRFKTGDVVDPSVAPGRMALVAPARNHDPGDEDRSER